MVKASRSGPRFRGRWRVRAIGLVAVGLFAGGAATAFGHGEIPPSLHGLSVPAVPGLLSGKAPIVRNRNKAIALGKALFWDAQVGSDGMACASCHFHAGADARVKNQLAPGRPTATRPSAATFEPTGSGGAGGPNYTLRLGDFPFHRLSDATAIGSTVLFDSDDVVGSAGAYAATFQDADDTATSGDRCTLQNDTPFAVGGTATRQVTSRNAPSVVNAVFNHRNFWDGRATTTFNGANGRGDRDPAAGVWIRRGARMRRKSLRLTNASLASQAVEPPLDTTEMSCAGRTFPDLGRKLLARRALQFQAVDAHDSVLAEQRHRSGSGLRATYRQLVRAAFDRRFWSAKASHEFGAPTGGGATYTQMEANFAFFFGLAVQLYESTLIADDTPFDSPRGEDGVPQALDDQQRRGLAVFVDLHCANCHSGPTLSGSIVGRDPAAVTEVDRKPIRSASGPMTLGLVDTGFLNTGVVSEDGDPGLGGVDRLGTPFAFVDQWLDVLAGRAATPIDAFVALSCNLTAPFTILAFGQPPFPAEELVPDPAGSAPCAAPRWSGVPSPAVVVAETAAPDGRLARGVANAFKIPSLRNVELTAPYMHNGGMATLDEVVEFYNRGGNFITPGKDAEFLFATGAAPELLADLVAFLRALTDERVRWERAPFDHPALSIPHGHVGDEHGVQDAHGTAVGEFLEIPAVGASGRTVEMGPLTGLATLLH